MSARTFFPLDLNTHSQNSVLLPKSALDPTIDQTISSKVVLHSLTMHLSAILASTLALVSLTTARITGFSAPSTVAPGAPIEIKIRAENYVQPVQDVAMAFGITPVESHHPRSLGTFMGEKALGPGM